MHLITVMPLSSKLPKKLVHSIIKTISIAPIAVLILMMKSEAERVGSGIKEDGDQDWTEEGEGKLLS